MKNKQFHVSFGVNIFTRISHGIMTAIRPHIQQRDYVRTDSINFRNMDHNNAKIARLSYDHR